MNTIRLWRYKKAMEKGSDGTNKDDPRSRLTTLTNDKNGNNIYPNDDSTLPENRFELELEFVQALASPAYIHFLATSRSESDTGNGELLLQDPALIAFLRYLYDTWTRPEYIRFIQYPHSLYFLELLLENPAAAKEWTLPAYRNFAHQQQFLSWQHRHSTYYGVGSNSVVSPEDSMHDKSDLPNNPVGKTE